MYKRVVVSIFVFNSDKIFYLKRHKSQRNGEIKGDMFLKVPNTREMCFVLFYKNSYSL